MAPSRLQRGNAATRDGLYLGTALLFWLVICGAQQQQTIGHEDAFLGLRSLKLLQLGYRLHSIARLQTCLQHPQQIPVGGPVFVTL